jgi:hypothetical protein
MTMEQPITTLQPLSYAVEQRLRMIDMLLAIYGHVGREPLMDYFGTSSASATRDFAAYIERAPGNLILDCATHTYIRTPAFKRLWA